MPKDSEKITENPFSEHSVALRSAYRALSIGFSTLENPIHLAIRLVYPSLTRLPFDKNYVLCQYWSDEHPEFQHQTKQSLTL